MQGQQLRYDYIVMPDTAHAFVEKPVLTEKMPGVFSEFMRLRRSSSLCSQNPRNLGKSSIR